MADAAFSRGVRGQHADRGQQLADTLHRRLTFGDDTEYPTVAFDEHRPEPPSADLVLRAWRRTSDGMRGQSPPSDDDLRQAAAVIRQRAVAAAHRAAEQRVVAQQAQRAREAADAAVAEVTTEARRAELRRQLAALDQES